MSTDDYRSGECRDVLQSQIVGHEHIVFVFTPPSSRIVQLIALYILNHPATDVASAHSPRPDVPDVSRILLTVATAVACRCVAFPSILTAFPNPSSRN